VSVDQGLIDWVSEALAPIGEVSMRRMMGGATLYCDGIIFAIAAMDELWFKADKISDAVWDAEQADRFSYARKGQIATMNYRRAPGDVHDDPEAMIRWAEIAIAAGRRSAK
jgi:DNA transformation protein